MDEKIAGGMKGLTVAAVTKKALGIPLGKLPK